MHTACDVPNFGGRKAVASFVAATLERCSVRIRSLLDNELADAGERIHSTDRARIERLARRDEAIASELAAMLRARAAGDGAFQPLLFEDIAIEKTTLAGQTGACRTRAPVSHEAGADGGAASMSLNAAERVESTLVMALVLPRR
jgi:hypothetical protein